MGSVADPQVVCKKGGSMEPMEPPLDPPLQSQIPYIPLAAPAYLQDVPSKGLVLRLRTEAGRVDQESIQTTL